MPRMSEKIMAEATSAARQKRIRDMCNRLALAPVRTCKTLHQCVWCAQPITYGEEYLDRGHGARAHVYCFKAVSAEYGKK